jgi:hypothetical protein
VSGLRCTNGGDPVSRQVIVTCDFCGSQRTVEGAGDWRWRNLDVCAGRLAACRPVGEVLELIRRVVDAGELFVGPEDIIPRTRPRQLPRST